MRAPDFWWRECPSALARLLLPVAAVQGAVAGRRMGRAGRRAPLPVVCVGNFTAGGAGKTPIALALAALLARAGERPAFLTRGYGGRLTGPLVVDPSVHDAGQVGDEPLLLAAAAPTIVARDRPAGAALAAARGTSVVVMDDGLQNPSLAKDLALAVVDGAVGLGNGLVLPAGPLRAPMARQWEAVAAVLIIGEGPRGAAVGETARRRGLVALTGRLVPEPVAGLAGERVLAFAGIGRPSKFFDTLAELGAEVAARRAFPDHHPYAPSEVAALVRQADREGLRLATTAKDRVRLVAAGVAPEILARIAIVPVRLVFDDSAAAQALLTRLQRRAA